MVFEIWRPVGVLETRLIFTPEIPGGEYGGEKYDRQKQNAIIIFTKKKILTLFSLIIIPLDPPSGTFTHHIGWSKGPKFRLQNFQGGLLVSIFPQNFIAKICVLRSWIELWMFQVISTESNQENQNIEVTPGICAYVKSAIFHIKFRGRPPGWYPHAIIWGKIHSNNVTILS